MTAKSKRRVSKKPKFITYGVWLFVGMFALAPFASIVQSYIFGKEQEKYVYEQTKSGYQREFASQSEFLKTLELSTGDLPSDRTTVLNVYRIDTVVNPELLLKEGWYVSIVPSDVISEDDALVTYMGWIDTATIEQTSPE